MREIKFRAWDKLNEIMCGVEVLDFVNKNVVLSSPAYGVIAFKDIELLEYTGLKDKNGKNPCEADLAMDNCGVIYRVIWVKDEAKFTLKLEHSHPTSDFEIELSAWNLLLFKIIGNIFQNPELSKET